MTPQNPNPIKPEYHQDGTIYMGPFFFKDGRYFYRDTHNQVWELKLNYNPYTPLLIEIVSK